MTNTENTPRKLTGRDEHVHKLLAQVKDEFEGAAHFLSEYGISTTLAQQAAHWLSQPLNFLSEMHDKAQRDAVPFLADIVVNYIRRVAAEGAVAGVWQVTRPDECVLEYTIALRENTLENRALFREFRLDYEDSGFGDLVPLVFHLIPEALAGRVLQSTPVALA